MADECLLALEKFRNHVQALARFVTPRLTIRLWHTYVGIPSILRDLVKIYDLLNDIDRCIENVKRTTRSEIDDKFIMLLICRRVCLLDLRDAARMISLGDRIYDKYIMGDGHDIVDATHEIQSILIEFQQRRLRELIGIDGELTKLDAHPIAS